MQRRWRRKVIIPSVVVILALGVAAWAIISQTSEAASRFQAEVQATADAIAGGLTIAPTVMLTTQCGGEVTQEALEVTEPDQITSDWLVSAVLEGCTLESASYDLKVVGKVPTEVTIATSGSSVTGRVTLVQNTNEARVQVDAVGQVGPLHKDVTVSAAASVRMETVKVEVERHLAEAMAHAVPAIAERNASAAPETVMAEEPAVNAETAAEGTEEVPSLKNRPRRRKRLPSRTRKAVRKSLTRKAGSSSMRTVG